ncbi:MAG TPA: DUF932 domain-containing protein [Spirillospora sp.]|nr:DUF932 domain-containing protein [Spirillospora sp.]
MSAEFDSGMFVREPAWHRMGNVVQERPESWQQAREWAGLLWEPVEEPVIGYTGDFAGIEARLEGLADGMSNDAEIDGLRDVISRFHVIEGRKRIVRSDTGATLGVPTSEYAIISHAEMGEVIEALLDQRNVNYETLVSLQGGRAIAALLQLDEPVQLPGDPSVTLPYLAVTTRHDGTGALKALTTSVRIVCWNTFSAAESQGERNGTAFTFGHSRGWRDRVEEAKLTLAGTRAEFAAYVEVAETLAKVPVTEAQATEFVARFVPMPPESLVSDRVVRNVEQARDAVRTILAGPTSDGIGGTAFGLVQAAGEYLDHYRAYRSMDSYFTRQLLRPEPLKAKAVQLVREIVGA